MGCLLSGCGETAENDVVGWVDGILRGRDLSVLLLHHPDQRGGAADGSLAPEAAAPRLVAANSGAWYVSEQCANEAST
jgi:hypothetical protein